MSYILEAMERQARSERIEDALRDVVVAYYDEYTDADHIDDVTKRALEVCFEYAYSSIELPMMIAQVQNEITSLTGRKFKKVELDD